MDKLAAERARLLRMLDSLRKDLGEVQKRASGVDDQAKQYLDIIRDLQNEVRALKKAEVRAKLANEQAAAAERFDVSFTDLFGADASGDPTDVDAADAAQVCGCIPS